MKFHMQAKKFKDLVAKAGRFTIKGKTTLPILNSQRLLIAERLESGSQFGHAGRNLAARNDYGLIEELTGNVQVGS